MEVAAFSYGANDGSSVRQRIRDGADLFLDLADTPDAEAHVAMSQYAMDIVVDLMATGYPPSLVWSLRLGPWLDLVRMGQDSAIEFLTTGETSVNPSLITRCPASASIVGHVCQP